MNGVNSDKIQPFIHLRQLSIADWPPSLLDNTAWNGTIQKDTTSAIKVKNTYEEKRQLTVQKTVNRMGIQ